jgi:hypothetical protein
MHRIWLSSEIPSSNYNLTGLLSSDRNTKTQKTAACCPNRVVLQRLLTIDQRFNICRYNLLQIACNFLNVPIPPGHFK